MTLIGCGRSSPSSAGSTSATSVVGSSAPAARLAFGPPVLRGQIVDERVGESSGLVASRRDPGRLWTHNDSDTPPMLFCVEADGTSCGGWTVAGATNVDWEDIAAGPGPDAGVRYLYIGDIGDNTQSRADVVVYRVVEPTVTASDRDGTTATTAPATAIRLRYDDGPHNAESLMVHPVTGDIYVVVKEVGDSTVYRAAPGDGILTRVGTLGLGLFGLATGADISPDGRRVAVCTPVGGYELTLADGAPFDSIWDGEARPVTFPALDQGEGIAYRLDGDALFVSSEGYPSPLYELPRL
jgi:hypothetical protein